MINYILQVILFQVLFLAVYDFFLSKETFFTKNRWYLLSTPVLSFLIPLIKIPTFQKVVPDEFVIQLPEIVLNPDKVIQQTITASNFTESINYINILFWVGVILSSVLFLMKLVKVVNFIKKHKVIKQDDFNLILIPNETKAFSFFNYVFLGDSIKETNRDKIIQHEMVHSKQKHSLDLLFFEVLKIVMWFNPMIYFYQKRITLVHEYISDAIVAKSETKETYINNLLSNFFQVENIAFINQFYKQTLIKKRILMMKKNQSEKVNQLKYLVLVPVLMSMLFYSSCVDIFSNENLESGKSAFKMYMISNGKLEVSENMRETYLDAFLGSEIPSEFKEVPVSELNLNEKEEFMRMQERFEFTNYGRYNSLKVFKMNSNRKIIGYIDYKIEVETKREEISFKKIDQAPTFPGCEEGDKDCFSNKIKEHLSKNLNKKLLN